MTLDPGHLVRQARHLAVESWAFLDNHGGVNINRKDCSRKFSIPGVSLLGHLKYASGGG